MLRVWTGSECPEDNLRELTGENFPEKGSNAQPDQLTEQRVERTPKESWPAAYRPLPSRWRQRGRRGTARAGRQGVTPILSAETSVLHQTVSRLPVANQVFLGSWMVDIHQEGRSLRPAPQRRHTAHLRQRSRSAPGEPRGWDREGE